MSNRAERRAAEREALKALRQNQNQNPSTPMDDAAIEAKRQYLYNLINAAESPKSSPETTTSNMHINEQKTNSAQNATKHGCCSESILLMKGENPADFKALETTWFKAYNPKDAAETDMVHELVEASWYAKRCTRKLAEMEAELMETGSPLTWSEDQHKALARFQRYHTARTNAVTKARKAVEDYRKNRNADVVKAEKHEIVKQKAKRKAEDEMSVEECLKEMEEIADLRRRSAAIEKEYGNL